MNRESGQEVEQFDKLFELRQSLEEKANTASEFSRDTYFEAIRNADDRLKDLAKSETVGQHIRYIGGPLIKALFELDELKPAIEAGLVDEGEIKDKEKEILDKADPRTRRLASYLGQISSSKVIECDGDEETNPKIITKGPTSARQETKTDSKIEIQLTYSDGAIGIGKNGKFVRTSNKSNESQHDYGPERVKALEVLINNYSGDEIRISELWKSAFGDQVFNRHVMTQIRKWFEKLTYRQQPLIIHNGKRGIASAYSINNRFDLRLVKQEVIEKQQEEIADISSLAQFNEEDFSPEETEALRPSSFFPLSRYEASVLATFLDMNNEILEKVGIPRISEEVVERLRNKVTTREMKLYERVKGTDIKSTRESVITAIATFFKDESKVLKAIGHMSEEDDRYGLFEYLFQIDGEERWRLFEQLKSIETKLTYKVDGGRRAGLAYLGGIKESKMGDIEVVTPIGESGEEEPISDSGTDEEPLTHEISNQEILEPRSEAILPDDKLQQSDVTPRAASLKAEMARFEKEFTKDVRGWIKTIDTYSLDGKILRTISHQFPSLTRSFVKNASENGLIARTGNNRLSKKDIICLMALSKYRDYMSITQRTAGPNRRAIEEMIKSELERKID